MDSGILIVAVSSAVIFVALVWHSLAALPRWRAVAFWISVLVYGAVRGFGVPLVTDGAGGPVLYEIRNPLVPVAGWPLVVYLAWWIGGRWTYLVAQVALASIFLGTIGWAIGAAAIAVNVPAIDTVEWFFAGIDFLLPFAAITARWRWRWWTLLFYPVHFAGHLLPGVYVHVVHWAIVLIVAAIALRTTVQEKPFNDSRSWVPTAAFGFIVMAVAVVVVNARQPRALISLVPAVLIWVGVLGGVRLRWLRRNWLVVLIAIVLAALVWFWGAQQAAPSLSGSKLPHSISQGRGRADRSRASRSGACRGRGSRR